MCLSRMHSLAIVEIIRRSVGSSHEGGLVHEAGKRVCATMDTALVWMSFRAAGICQVRNVLSTKYKTLYDQCHSRENRTS